MRARLIECLLLTAMTVWASAAQAETTVVLVRHAEKEASESSDPPLSEAGRRRAAALSHALGETPLEAVYITQYRRTRETVQPTAAEHELTPIQREAADVEATASAILREHAGARVLVCGHSNTVPDLIRALGVETDLTLSEEEYDDLFIVTIDDEGDASLLRLQYGAPSGRAPLPGGVGAALEAAAVSIAKRSPRGAPSG